MPAARRTHPIPRALLGLLLTGALALAGCGGERGGGSGGTSGSGKRISIATGNTTGVYYQLGGGYAEQITRNLQGYEATAEATGASVENLQRVAKGDSDVAFTLADSAADAVQGKASFSGPQPIQALARIYDNVTQVFARPGTGINTVAAMKGKRVSTGSPNSGTEVIALRLLKAAGLDPDKDIKRQALSLPETVQGMKDGSLDAMFWSGGLPTAGITDLITSNKDVKALPLDDLLAKMRAEYGPVYEASKIPAAAYKQGQDTATISVPNLLVVNQKMDEQLAYDLVRVLFEQKPALEKVHPEAKNIDIAKASTTDPVPLHPGAKRYLDQKK